MAIWKLSQEDKDKLLAESNAKQQELAILQGKSWSDLWAEDLETFNKALVDKENKDKKELEVCLEKAAAKLTKGTDAKGRKEKRMSKGMFDVMPSKDALRVVPTMDAMKEKYEAKPKKEKDPNAPPKQRKPREPKAPKDSSKAKAPRKKKLSETQNGTMDDFVERNGDDAESSTQMTNGTDDSPKENRKRKAVQKKPKESKAKKSPAKPKATKAPPKKKKAKKEWDSDESGADDDVSISESDLDDELEAPPPKREAAPRRTAAVKKPKYKLDTDDEEDAGGVSDASAELVPKPKARRIIDSEEDFD